MKTAIADFQASFVGLIMADRTTQSSEGTVYRFSLTLPDARPEMLRALLLLAVKETEILYGKARLKIETSYEVSARKAACLIEGGSECGEQLAKLLSGFLIRQVGESGFRVERLRRRPGRTA